MLDLGCGEGYGLALLAAVAESAVGVEVDPAAVEHSRSAYKGVDVRQGTVHDLSDFANDAFDVVTCFEVIEHVDRQEVVIEQADRVLADDGVFVISTPNRRMYQDVLHSDNPFHVHELDHEELCGLLRGRFANVVVLGQSVSVGSLIQPYKKQELGCSTTVTLERGDGDWGLVPTPEPTYFVALASNSPLPSLVSLSVLTDPGVELVRVLEDRAASLGASLSKADCEIDGLQQEVVRLQEYIASIHATKLMRWTASARRVYESLRRHERH